MIRRSPSLLALLSVAFAFSLSHASYAAAFIKFDGIDGESAAAGHEKWIEVQSFSWGATQAGAGATAAGAGRTVNTLTPPAGPGTLTLVKRIDAVTPRLQATVNARRRIANAILHVSAPEGGQRYLEYKLEDVLVSSFAPTSGGAIPTESLSVNFTRIQTSPVTVGAPARVQ